MIVLGIESTCDETAASLVEDGRRLLSNVISTSVKEQALYGGVVPEPAAATASSSAPRSKRLCWMLARPWTMWTRWPSPLRRA